MKKIQHVIIVILSIVLHSCGGGGADPVEEDTSPGKASLVFPANNEECNTGTSVSATLSKVNFQWNTGANTSSSQVVVKNLLTKAETKKISASNQVIFKLLKNTPYKWWVISRTTESTETAKSAEWKFYNSGEGITTYAPFPAELVAPSNGVLVTGTVTTLEWKGSDVDDDIVSYEVFFGTVNPPTNSLKTVTAPIHKIENVAVTTNTYYWKVITKDGEGNTSTSELFEFKVN